RQLRPGRAHPGPSPRPYRPEEEREQTPPLGMFGGSMRPSTIAQLLWLVWPMCGSVLLLAVTNKICQDVAVVPFLWVLPLALYLLSFVICFDHPRWYAPLPFSLLLIAALCAVCWSMFRRTNPPLRL